MSSVDELQKVIDDSHRIVSLAVREYLQRAVFPISEVWTDFIIKSTIIRRNNTKPYILCKKDRGVLSLLQR